MQKRATSVHRAACPARLDGDRRQGASHPSLQITHCLASGGLQQRDNPKFDTQDEVRPTGRWEPTCADIEPRRPTWGDRHRLSFWHLVIDNTFEINWSGWRDSNPRPPAPKAGALTKLRYIPMGSRSLPPPVRTLLYPRSGGRFLRGLAGPHRPGSCRKTVRYPRGGLAPGTGCSHRAGVAQWQSPSLPSWS
jgi:hypothetical protein